MNRKLPFLLSLILILSLALAACAPENGANNGVGNGTNIDDPLATEALPDTGLDETPVIEDDLIEETPVIEDDLIEETPVVEDDQVEETPAVTEDLGDDETVEPVTGTQLDLNRASNLLGQPIADAADEELGSINSLVIDSQSGQIAYVLVDAGPALEIENDLAAIPWSQLTFSEEPAALDAGDAAATDEVDTGAEATAETIMDDVTETRIVYSGDLATLQGAPSFALADLDDDDDHLLDTDLEDELFGYWSNEGAVLPQTGDDDDSNGLVRLDVVEDLQLTNMEGEDLGDIEDIILDRTQGMITYMIVATGGLLDIGEELIAVPYERFEYQADDDDGVRGFVLNVSQEDLEAAPRFPNADEIPDTNETGWDDEFNQFWQGVENTVDDAADDLDDADDSQ